MPLTVLTDQDVRDCLETLTKEDVLEFHKSLADALHNYSTATDSADSGCCSSNQPSRIVVKQRDGSTTLFMPSMSDSALGVKVLTISEGSSKQEDTATAQLDALKLSEPQSPSLSSHSSFSKASRTSTESSSTKPFDQQSTTSTTPSTAPSTTSNISSTHPKLAEDIRAPTSLLESSDTSPKGSVTILHPSGQPRAIINASTLTAFRTALASTLLLKLRQKVHTLTVFGAGLQAYWHIYLTLLLRPSEVHHLHIVNRDFNRAQRLLMTLAQSGNEGISDEFLGQKLRPAILTPEYSEYARLLKEQVRAADVIYCCTPSTTPLFPASFLTNSEGRRKARYVIAIGSYKPHMQELPYELLQQAVRGPLEDSEHKDKHHHGLHLHKRHAHEGGAVIVDTIEGAMKEAGEVIKAGIGGQGVVELGELVMLKRGHWAEKAEREAKEREKRERQGKAGSEEHKHAGHGLGHLFKRSHSDHGEKKEKDKHHVDGSDGGLWDWLTRGNVIYKSVGLGLMDLVVGNELVRLAEERGFGTHVPDF